MCLVLHFLKFTFQFLTWYRHGLLFVWGHLHSKLTQKSLPHSSPSHHYKNLQTWQLDQQLVTPSICLVSLSPVGCKSFCHTAHCPWNSLSCWFSSVFSKINYFNNIIISLYIHLSSPVSYKDSEPILFHWYFHSYTHQSHHLDGYGGPWEWRTLGMAGFPWPWQRWSWTNWFQ